MLQLTKEDVLEIAKNYTYKTDFKEQEKKIHTYSRNKGWLKEVCSHMIKKSTSPKTVQECHNVALRYTNYMEFIKKDTKYFIYAKRKGWLQDITSHMNKRNIWDHTRYEEAKTEASKYKNKNQFKKFAPKHHNAAYRYGWLNELYK